MHRPTAQPRADRAPRLTPDALAAFVADAQARFKPRPLLQQLLDSVPDTVDTSCPPCGRVWARPLGAELECPVCADVRGELLDAQALLAVEQRESAGYQNDLSDEEYAHKRTRGELADAREALDAAIERAERAEAALAKESDRAE